MPAPRKPTAVHELTGATKVHPERFRDRAGEPHDDRPLGPPPEHLQPAQRAAWAEIERLAPWLAYADRIIVEMCAVMVASFRKSGDITRAVDFARLQSALGELGLTPASRSKVTGRSVRRDNPFSKHGHKPEAS